MAISSASCSTATRSPAGALDASAPSIAGTTPAPEPTTRTFARAAMHASRNDAMPRESPPVRTISSIDPSTRRRFRTVSTHELAAGGATATMCAPRARRRSMTSSPSRQGSPDWCARRATTRPSASSLVNEGSASTGCPPLMAST